MPGCDFVCRFRFPRFQFDHLFTGCHPVWGHEYRLIRCAERAFWPESPIGGILYREWLLPPWLLTVQALLLLSLLLSIFARLLSVLAILRFPVTVFLRSFISCSRKICAVGDSQSILILLGARNMGPKQIQFLLVSPAFSLKICLWRIKNMIWDGGSTDSMLGFMS